jgi:hypothetical protein
MAVVNHAASSLAPLPLSYSAYGPVLESGLAMLALTNDVQWKRGL